MAGSSRSSSAKLVSTITRASGSRSRSARIAPTPSRLGITRSIRITSGRRRSASLTACSPSSASPTTSSPSWRSRNVRSPSRTTAWSSTSSTRIEPSGNVHLQAHGGALARLRVDLQPRTDPLGPLLHRGEPEAARAQLGVRRIEADAVVADLELKLALRRPEPHAHLLCLRVPHGVLQRLLRDAEHLVVAPARRRGVVDLQLDGHAVELGQHLRLLAQRAAQPVAVEVRRAQLVDQRAQLVERLARQLLEPL